MLKYLRMCMYISGRACACACVCGWVGVCMRSHTKQYRTNFVVVTATTIFYAKEEKSIPKKNIALYIQIHTTMNTYIF